MVKGVSKYKTNGTIDESDFYANYKLITDEKPTQKQVAKWLSRITLEYDIGKPYPTDRYG